MRKRGAFNTTKSSEEASEIRRKVYEEISEAKLAQLKEIRRHIEAAAEQGCSAAAYTCGLNYRDGKGGPVDVWKAKDFFEMAAEAGHDNASLNLGILTSTWNFDVESDDSDGSDSDFHSDDVDDSDSDSDSDEIDFEKEMTRLPESLKHYLRAAQGAHLLGSGSADAASQSMNNLGVAFFEGNGVKRNHRKAIKWYKKSAELGQVVAQRNLGIMYENGYGVDVDIKEANRWLRLAADNDSGYGAESALAMIDLATNYFKEDPDRNHTRALLLCKQDVAKNDGAREKANQLSRQSTFKNKKKTCDSSTMTILAPLDCAASSVVLCVLADFMAWLLTLI